MVDGTEDCGWIVCLHEGAWTVIDGLSRDGSGGGVHDAMNEAEEQPLCDQARLAGDHSIEQGAVGLLRLRGVRVVPGDGIIGQRAGCFGVALCGEKLEGADAEVAGSDSGEYGSRQGCFAQHSVARCDRGERPGGWHAESRHGLADDVLAQDRTEGGSAVAAAGEGGWTGALEPGVVARAGSSHH